LLRPPIDLRDHFADFFEVIGVIRTTKCPRRVPHRRPYRWSAGQTVRCGVVELTWPVGAQTGLIIVSALPRACRRAEDLGLRLTLALFNVSNFLRRID